MKLYDYAVALVSSSRSMAYVRAMQITGVFPREAVVLDGAGRYDRKALVEESRRWGYSDSYFDPDGDPVDNLREAGVSITHVNADGINHAKFQDAVVESSACWWLYTGGGIVSPETLSLGRFVHVHPGFVPEYRGSTCFYYSLLEQGEVGATAFIMEADLDAGDVLCRARYSVNQAVSSDMPLFMDHVLDASLRAEVLKQVLLTYAERGQLVGTPQEQGEKPPYFVMHPCLRALATKRLSMGYDVGRPSGLHWIG